MKLSAADITVAIDTLQASLPIAGDSSVWRWSKTTRENAMRRMIKVLETLQVDVTQAEAQS